MDRRRGGEETGEEAEAFEVLEPDDRKLPRPVLRGLDLSNGVRLLGPIYKAAEVANKTRFLHGRPRCYIERLSGGS